MMTHKLKQLSFMSEAARQLVAADELAALKYEASRRSKKRIQLIHVLSPALLGRMRQGGFFVYRTTWKLNRKKWILDEPRVVRHWMTFRVLGEISSLPDVIPA